MALIRLIGAVLKTSSSEEPSVSGPEDDPSGKNVWRFLRYSEKSPFNKEKTMRGLTSEKCPGLLSLYKR